MLVFIQLSIKPMARASNDRYAKTKVPRKIVLFGFILNTLKCYHPRTQTKHETYSYCML